MATQTPTNNAIVLAVFERLRKGHGPYYDRVKAFHEANASTRQRGHGMEHNVHVALHAIDIAMSDYGTIGDKLAELVFLASIGHSLDRLVDRGDDAGFRGLVTECLGLVKNLPDNTIAAIFEAIEDHGKKNDEGRKDSTITVVLKDADRVANIGAALAIRSGQFTPNIAPYEMAYLRTPNPASTYRDPSSVVEDLRGCFEWGDWMRTKRGKEMFDRKAGNLHQYLALVAQEFEMIGMDGVVI